MNLGPRFLLDKYVFQCEFIRISGSILVDSVFLGTSQIASSPCPRTSASVGCLEDQCMSLVRGRPRKQRLAPLLSPEALLRRRGTTVPATVRRISSLRFRRRASERRARAPGPQVFPVFPGTR